MPEGLKFEISMDVDTPALLDFGDIRFRVKNRMMATKMPGFRFSSYR